MGKAATCNHLDKLGPLVRLDLFTDAVFAIVITLLALEIKLPKHTDDANLLVNLHRMYPIFLAHVISFAVLGIEWIDHHTIFESAVKCTRGLMLSNLLFCLTLTSIPFLTQLLGLFPDSQPAVALYSLGILVMTGAKELLWQVILRQGETSRRGKFRVRHGAAMCVGIVSTGAGLIYPFAVVFVWSLFGIYSVFRRLEWSGRARS